MRALLLVPLLAACGDGPVVTNDVTDLQSVCVDGDAFLVTFVGCLSSSCDTLASSSCTAALAGDVITVTGTARVRSQGRECTSDCGSITARCAVPEVDDPTAVIVQFGGDDGGPTLADAGCTSP